MKEVMQTGLYLYLIRYNLPNCYLELTNVSITKDRYVFSNELEAVPIEDLGDYIISDQKLQDPVEEWLILVDEPHPLGVEA